MIRVFGRLRAAHRLWLVFAATVLVPGVLLGFFGLRALLCERRLADQQVRERLVAAAEDAARRVELEFSPWRQVPSADPAAWPPKLRQALAEPGAAVVLAGNGQPDGAVPPGQVLFALAPLPHALQELPPAIAEAEAVELRAKDFARAAVMYRRLLPTLQGSNRTATLCWRRVRTAAVAAKARLHLGLCYEKSGNLEARRAYERVLANYADQPEIASEARARLAGLSRPAGSVASMATRLVWSGQDADGSGMPTADGRFLTFTDWNTGDAALRDLAAGTMRRLTNKASWADSLEFADYSVPSPDGKQVVYVWYNKDGRQELRLISTGGGKPRVVLANEQIQFHHPTGWSADAKSVLAVLTRKDNTSQIGWISLADGSVRTLKSLEWRYPEGVSISPDGRNIVYDLPRAQDSPGRDMFLLSADGSSEIPLIQDSGTNFSPVWSPDGAHVLFVSDRAGSYGLWSIAIVNGKPGSAPQLIKSDIGEVHLMGITRYGALIYARTLVLRTAIGSTWTRQLENQPPLRGVSANVSSGPIAGRCGRPTAASLPMIRAAADAISGWARSH